MDSCLAGLAVFWPARSLGELVEGVNVAIGRAAPSGETSAALFAGIARLRISNPRRPVARTGKTNLKGGRDEIPLSATRVTIRAARAAT
jgi:hypothetical protein